MQFTTFDFFLFFPIAVLIYYIVPKKGRRLWLLAVSYYFYMCWGITYIFVMLVTTLISYGCGLLLERNKESVGRKRIIVISGITICILILAFFKYFYFLHDSLTDLLHAFGGVFRDSELNIMLPIGISYYTFQVVGYIIDVYRGTISAERNLLTYALFVSFFPKQAQGPIERSSHMLPQLEQLAEKRIWDFDKVTRGLLMMLWGYFMKLVIADRAAIFVDTVFEDYYAYYGVALIMAMVLFSIQLYCDFASYSAIAIGAAQVLGIDLLANFAAPFFAKSVGEFWRRWHMSLSLWLRDYVYIPLGGGKCAAWKKYRNRLITFFVSGLWHGASWNFVFWGVLQGVFINIGDFVKPVKKVVVDRFHVKTQSAGYRAGQVSGTYLLFLLSFTFFRSDSIQDGFYYLQRVWGHFDPWSLLDGSLARYGLDTKEWFVLGMGVLILFLVDLYYEKKRVYFDSMLKNQCLAVQYIAVIGMILMIFVFGIYGEGYDASQFIYFKF